MAVDVQTEIEIDRPRHEVATYAADPDNATVRYENIKSIELKTDKPLAIGAPSRLSPPSSAAGSPPPTK